MVVVHIFRLFRLNALNRHEFFVEFNNRNAKEDTFRRESVIDTDNSIAVAEEEVFAGGFQRSISCDFSSFYIV